MATNFSNINGAFTIVTNGVTVWSGNQLIHFKHQDDKIWIYGVGDGWSLSLPSYYLSEIGTIGGDPVAGTIEGAITQLTNILPSQPTAPLPTGAATSELQTTGNTSLSSIDTKTLALSATSTNNSTTTPLNNNQTFTGTSDLNLYPEVLVVCYTDQSGILYVEFSQDGTNWDSSLSFNVAATTNEIHRFIKGNRYFRVRFTNDSGANQTYLRIASYFGQYAQITSALNSQVQIDADANVARILDTETMISQGLFQNYSLTNKFGRNTNVASMGQPYDIANATGVYAGFPTGSPEEFQIVCSSSSDIGGTVTFQYLATKTSTSYQTASILITGLTTNTGITGYRSHTAQFAATTDTAFNVGTITLRHITTTANIFWVMAIGTSQTYMSGYTVPVGSTGYIKRLFCYVYNNTAGSVQGGLWVRVNGGSPRIRRPFSASNTDHFEERVYGGLPVASGITGGSDVIVRVTQATGSVTVIAGYDMVLIRNS